MIGLTIPDSIVAQTDMSPSELLLEFAVFLYERRHVTLAQAARLAGLDRIAFQQALVEHGVRLNFDIEDLEQELGTIEKVKDAYRKRHIAH